jgi:hypothetical protein
MIRIREARDIYPIIMADKNYGLAVNERMMWFLENGEASSMAEIDDVIRLYALQEESELLGIVLAPDPDDATCANCKWEVRGRASQGVFRCSDCDSEMDTGIILKDDVEFVERSFVYIHEGDHLPEMTMPDGHISFLHFSIRDHDLDLTTEFMIREDLINNTEIKNIINPHVTDVYNEEWEQRYHDSLKKDKEG